METDKHYFFEGLFIIGFTVAAALFFVWLGSSGHRDDVLYRIRFGESVSGLSIGEAVRYRGVDVGSVRSMAIDKDNPRIVQVEVKLRKDTPVKTDTSATLKMKGITGVVFVELSGGSPNAKSLAEATPDGEVPLIAWEKSAVTAVFEQLPKVIQKFSAIETQTQKVLSDVGEVTEKVKEDPSLLLRRPKKKEAAATP